LPLANPACFAHLLVFSRDGKYLAAGDHSGQVTLWEVEGGQRRLLRDQPPGPGRRRNGPAVALAFSPNGRLLAILDSQQRLEVVDTATLRTPAGFKSPAETFLSVCFTADGKQIIGVDGQGQTFCYEARDGKQVQAAGGLPAAEPFVMASFDPKG